MFVQSIAVSIDPIWVTEILFKKILHFKNPIQLLLAVFLSEVTGKL